MTYLVLAEERDLPYGLLAGLAEVVAECPGLVPADAIHQLRSVHGILAIPGRAEAERLSARFAALGAPAFLLDSLLYPPEPEPLHLMQSQVQGAVEIAAVASLHPPTEQRAVSANPLSRRTAEDHDARYALDVFAHGRHWRAEPDVLALVERFLGEADLSAAYLGAGVRSLQGGERHLPMFASEHDYDRYLTWLYQLRYAAR